MPSLIQVFCISTKLVELHLYDVLEVLLVLNYFLLEINTIGRFTQKLRRLLKLNFNLPCRTSPRCCSRGSPGDLILKVLYYFKKCTRAYPPFRSFWFLYFLQDELFWSNFSRGSPGGWIKMSFLQTFQHTIYQRGRFSKKKQGDCFLNGGDI